jgi:hypothetical protein
MKTCTHATFVVKYNKSIGDCPVCDLECLIEDLKNGLRDIQQLTIKNLERKRTNATNNGTNT